MKQVRQIFNHFIHRHPRLFNLKLSVKYIFQVRSKIKRQLTNTNHIRDLKTPFSGINILIPLIETSHYQYLQLLILGKALELRGAHIKVLVCDEILEACEIKSSNNSTYPDNCVNCRFNRKHILPLYGLDVITLSSLISDREMSESIEMAKSISRSSDSTWSYKGYDISRTVSESITRYYYGGSAPSESDNEQLIRRNIHTSILGFIAAKKINDEFKPNVILNNMNVYSAWAPYTQYYGNRKDVRISTISINQFNYRTIIFNINELYLSNKRYKRYLSSRDDSTLNETENKELNNFVNCRVRGESEIFRDLGFFDDNNHEKSFKTRERRNIFLFSNIFWDVGLSECDNLYSSVLDWVIDTINIVKDLNDVDLYIKTHPGELYDTAKSKKGVESYIREQYPTLPNNVFLINPQDKINTYSLFNKIDIGVVFNGTLGLEMLLHGIPVIITGQAPFSNLRLVNEPRSFDEYRSLLLGSRPILEPEIERIRMFAYFYFIKSCIPWKLTESAYANNFKGYNFKTLNELDPGVDPYLDHLCNCIIYDDIVIENW